MRVISGKYKNSPLLYPKNIRPSAQKHKKIVFDTIINDIQNQSVADIFAGSGQMGIEALSLGASHVTFVENDHKCINIIKKNLHKLNIPPEKYTIYSHSVQKLIAGAGYQFDVIILDPPYLQINWNDLKYIHRLSHPNTILILKYSPHNPPPPFNHWILIKQKDLKDTIINFYLSQ